VQSPNFRKPEIEAAKFLAAGVRIVAMDVTTAMVVTAK
jgi:hypothetical protein